MKGERLREMHAGAPTCGQADSVEASAVQSCVHDAYRCQNALSCVNLFTLLV